MDTDKHVKQLHDKATRGMKISSDDQALLDAWYARQDAEENALLASTHPQETLANLQAQVDTSVTHLLTATQRVQDLSHQNDELRREITALKQQLATAPQPA